MSRATPFRAFAMLCVVGFIAAYIGGHPLAALACGVSAVWLFWLGQVEGRA